MKPEMPVNIVLELLQLFEQEQIAVVLDGGWGVDALLERQTRAHSDLDIALEHRDLPRLRALLEARGYKDIPRPDTRDCNMVLGNAQGHQLDIHTYIYDEQGTFVFGIPYPLESLTGQGSILGRPVRCIEPGWMVRFHTGYPLDEDDYRDVSALCERFGLEMPADYERFQA